MEKESFRTQMGKLLCPFFVYDIALMNYSSVIEPGNIS